MVPKGLYPAKVDYGVMKGREHKEAIRVLKLLADLKYQFDSIITNTNIYPFDRITGNKV